MSSITPEMEKLIDQRVQEALQKSGIATQKNRLALIASQGKLDAAYPPLIIASTAAAMDMEAAIFFTFYGLYILHKDKGARLQVPPLANPAMPMPVPNIIGVIPGMTAMATTMMKSMFGKVQVPSIPDLLNMCVEGGVRLIACQMTMDAMGIKREELIDDIEVGGAATFLGYAAESSVNMFM